ncbi:MAG TPA: hypothetical protein VF676_11110 [Flavobacterium sp.]|jgi:hypothetical protein
MATSIPFDHPSLVLGNIADQKVLNILANITKHQSLITASRDTLNSLIMMKRSIGMTINELTDLGIDTSAIQDKLTEINQSITDSATAYLTASMENSNEILQQRQELSSLAVMQVAESPVDFLRSELKSLPLASESLNFDSQYFSYSTSLTDTTIANIEKYVRNSTSSLGAGAEKAAAAASSQINMQLQNHSIAGTLIITATCTHSNVKMFTPLVIDPDKAIAAWNAASSNPIDTDKLKLNPDSTGDTDEAEVLQLLSGAAYGSSFIGMVHILNSDSGNSNTDPSDGFQEMLEEKLKQGSWIKGASGDFGVDASFINEVKQLLNNQSISSHVSVIVLGAVPTIASGKLKMGIKMLGGVKDAVVIREAAALETPGTLVSDARNRTAEVSTKNAKNQAIIKELGKIDHEANNVMDINSLMNAFDNYLAAVKDKSGNMGIPISFTVKNLTRAQITNLWKDKYFPDKNAVQVPIKP